MAKEKTTMKAADTEAADAKAADAKEATSEDSGPEGITLEEFKSWPAEKRHGLSLAVQVGFELGKTLLDAVPFDGKQYGIGYVKPVIDRVEAEEAEAEVFAEKVEPPQAA